MSLQAHTENKKNIPKQIEALQTKGRLYGERCLIEGHPLPHVTGVGIGIGVLAPHLVIWILREPGLHCSWVPNTKRNPLRQHGHGSRPKSVSPQ